mgnify:FL=1
MKSILIIAFALLLYSLDSCTSNQTDKTINESPIDYSQYKETYIISYGDDRFHQCDELVDVVYGVTHDGDTLELKTIQRECTELQKKNYDIKDSRANLLSYPRLPQE